MSGIYIIDDSFVTLFSRKLFERGSSFCSLTQPKLQNEDPVGFASFGVRQKRLSEGLRFVVMTRPKLQNEDPVGFACDSVP